MHLPLFPSTVNLCKSPHLFPDSKDSQYSSNKNGARFGKYITSDALASAGVPFSDTVPLQISIFWLRNRSKIFDPFLPPKGTGSVQSLLEHFWKGHKSMHCLSRLQNGFTKDKKWHFWCPEENLQGLPQASEYILWQNRKITFWP